MARINPLSRRELQRARRNWEDSQINRAERRKRAQAALKATVKPAKGESIKDELKAAKK